MSFEHLNFSHWNCYYSREIAVLCFEFRGKHCITDLTLDSDIGRSLLLSQRNFIIQDALMQVMNVERVSTRWDLMRKSECYVKMHKDAICRKTRAVLNIYAVAEKSKAAMSGN